MKNYPRGIGLVILASLFWATSSILINLIVQKSGIAAVSLAFWRDLTTSIVLSTFALILRPGLFAINRDNLPWLIGIGVISIGLFHVLWNTSVVLFGASIATLLQSNAPVFVTIIAWLFYRETITSKKSLRLVFRFWDTQNRDRATTGYRFADRCWFRDFLWDISFIWQKNSWQY